MNEQGFFASIPERHRNWSLDNCNALPEGLIEFGRQWAKNWPPISLFIMGVYGCGKTCFVFALIRELFRNTTMPLWPRWFTSPELDGLLLEHSRSHDGDRYILNDLAEQDLLIIDDVGRETRSDRLRRQYFEIFNKRYVNNKPTILTSNFQLEQLHEIIDPAIVSRMQEWEIIEFPAKDLRKKEARKF